MKKILIVLCLGVQAFGDSPPPIVKLSQELADAFVTFHDSYQLWVMAKDEELQQPGSVNYTAYRLWNNQVKPQMQGIQKIFKEMDLVLRNQ